MSSTAARVAVIIPTWHGGDLLGRCLTSLSEQTCLPTQVVVVVANPAGVPLPAAEGWPFPIRSLHPGHRVHYGAAVNVGFAGSGTDDCLVLNDDTRAEPDFIAALCAARSEAPGAMLQPRILLDGTRGIDNTGHRLFPDGMTWARGRGQPDGPTFDTPGPVGAVSGAAFLVPRAVLTDLGGFDESFVVYAEDLDLSLRAVRRGVELRYVPGARIVHELGASYGRSSFEKLYNIEKNRVRAALRSLPATAVVGLPLLTGARWVALALVDGDARAGWQVRVGPRGAAAALMGAVAGSLHARDALHKRRADQSLWRVGELGMWRHLLRERVRREDL